MRVVTANAIALLLDFDKSSEFWGAEEVRRLEQRQKKGVLPV